jgi:transposase
MSTSSKSIAIPEKLRSLVGLRIDLVEMRFLLKKHLDGRNRTHCKDRVDTYMNYLQKNIDELSADIANLVKQDHHLSKNAEIIASVPGVSQLTAAILAVDMPWMGKTETKRTAGPEGIAPYTKDNGMYIDGDRAIQRRELYEAVIKVVQQNKKISAFYEKQLKDGKSKDEALISAMFKLIVIINSMLKRGTKWADDLDADAPRMNRPHVTKSNVKISLAFLSSKKS